MIVEDVSLCNYHCQYQRSNSFLSSNTKYWEIQYYAYSSYGTFSLLANNFNSAHSVKRSLFGWQLT